MNEKLKTVSELCETLNLGRTKIYSLIKEDRIKAFKIGRKTLFRQSDIDALIASLSTFGGK